MEGFTLAIQDKIITTRNYRKYIIKETMDTGIYRKCYQSIETVEHITGGYKLLAGTKYTDKYNIHNRRKGHTPRITMAKQLHTIVLPY